MKAKRSPTDATGDRRVEGGRTEQPQLRAALGALGHRFGRNRIRAEARAARLVLAGGIGHRCPPGGRAPGSSTGGGMGTGVGSGCAALFGASPMRTNRCWSCVVTPPLIVSS